MDPERCYPSLSQEFSEASLIRTLVGTNFSTGARALGELLGSLFGGPPIPNCHSPNSSYSGVCTNIYDLPMLTESVSILLTEW